MYLLKSLAEKGKSIARKAKEVITKIPSKTKEAVSNVKSVVIEIPSAAKTFITDLPSKAKAVVIEMPSKAYTFITEVPHKAKEVISTLTSTAKRAGTKVIEGVKSLKERIFPRRRTEEEEQERVFRNIEEKIREDEDLFIYKIDNKVLMADINIPVEPYGNRNIFTIKDELIDDIYHIIRRKAIQGKISLGFRMIISVEALFYNVVTKVSEIIRKTSGSFKRASVYVGTLGDLRRAISTCISDIEKDIQNVSSSETGNIFKKFTSITVRLLYFITPSSIIDISDETVKQGFKYRELPEWIRKSKSISNIKNKDDLCLVWAILRSLYPAKDRHHNMITSELKEKYKEYDWCGLDDPSQINEKNLCKFEDKYNFKIVIFKVTDKPKYKVIHLRRFENEDERRKIYLGYYIDHYFVIFNLDGFIRHAISKISKHTGKVYVCEYCYKHMYKETAYIKHTKHCKEDFVEYRFPDVNYMYFKRIFSTLRYPGVVYADFEATNIRDNTIKNAIFKQIPNSFCIFCPDFEILEVRYSSNPEELFDEFWKILMTIYRALIRRYKDNKVKIDKSGRIPKDAECDFCKFIPEEFRSGSKKLVRYFDHFTGEFLGYACSVCIKKLGKPKFVRVFFHNLKGYDSHFIIKYAINRIKTWDTITPLGKSKEKLFAIKVPFERKSHGIYFLDSYSHLPFSLSQLVKDYITNYRYKNFLPLNGEYKHKEAYPYEWVDSFDKFFETKFPPRSAFYNRLNNKTISEQEYNEVKSLYDKYCVCFKDYHDIYLRGDVVLLAEVFEKYRDLSIESYGIDPAWYVSGPSFFYNAMMKMCKAKLPIINDEKLYKLVKNGIRGGICGVGEISEAEADGENTCIVSLDCVNLYGKAMMDPLPINILEYCTEVTDKKLEDFLKGQPDNIGYILEVDIVPPLGLHDFLKGYPLFPEKIDNKLLQTLNPKEKYLVLDKYLKYGLELGYEVTKIHSYIKIEKAPIMRPYIEYNTEKRRIASEKKENSKVQYYKNANNSVYGKNIENPEKYCNYIIARGEEALKIYSEGKWKDFIIIDNDNKIMLFDIAKEKVLLDKPILLGFCILDISKEIMARHFYNLRKHLPFKLIYTDTDSFKIFCYEHGEKAAYEILKSLDFIETPESKIKKVPGKLAFEEFNKYIYAIASKHYIVDNKEKCKGVPYHCTTTEYRPERTYYSIVSKNHEIAIVENKKILKYEDDKKIKIDNENFPYGYIKDRAKI